MQTELNTPTDTENRPGFRSCWSMGDMLLLSKQPAINGTVTISYPSTNHWGENSPSYEVTDPTYMKLWEICDKLITESGDEHHIFIEDVSYNKVSNEWELITGS